MRRRVAVAGVQGACERGAGGPRTRAPSSRATAPRRPPEVLPRPPARAPRDRRRSVAPTPPTARRRRRPPAQSRAARARARRAPPLDERDRCVGAPPHSVPRRIATAAARSALRRTGARPRGTSPPRLRRPFLARRDVPRRHGHGRTAPRRSTRTGPRRRARRCPYPLIIARRRNLSAGLSSCNHLRASCIAPPRRRSRSHTRSNQDRRKG